MDYNEIIQSLRDSFEVDAEGKYTNCALVFAYNGIGKTRLSYEFSHFGRDEETPPCTLYYNAYTEDLFTWDNDIDNDSEEREYKLIINKDSALIQGLAGYDLTADLHKYLQVFTDIDFKFHYEKIAVETAAEGEEQEERAEGENEAEIPTYVVFSKKKQYYQELNGEQVLIEEPIENIKISRGEERLFIWCFFRCILDQVINGNEAYKDFEYIYIDDPMSSLDDNNVIAFAQQLYSVVRQQLRNEVEAQKEGREYERIKFVISSHHALFFHVMVHGLDNDKKLGRYYLHRDRQADELVLKKMSDETPFYYNVAMMSEIEKAIKEDKLYTYHFTIMRSVIEKIEEFFGHFDHRFVLDGIKYKGTPFDQEAFGRGELVELYSRIVNVFSHQGSFFAPVKMNDDNKVMLKNLFYHIKNKYRFILPHLDDERSEREIVQANRN